MSSAEAAARTKKICGFDPASYEVSRSYSILEIERSEMAGMEEIVKVLPNVPKVPFGFQNPEWVYLKSIARPGDKIIYFRWRPRPQPSESGVALVRACRVLHKVVTDMG